MRIIRDGQGHEWECGEIAGYGIGDRPASITTAIVRANSGNLSVDIEMNPGELARLSDAELSQTIDAAYAWQKAELNRTTMRGWTDSSGVVWLVSEEGLPGKSAGQKGGICLRFISRHGTRYLCPVPAWWAHEADSSLENYFNRAIPSLPS